MHRPRIFLFGLLTLLLCAGPVMAGDKDDEIERILKKYDEKFRQLREEMKREIEKLTGAGGPQTQGAPWLGVDVEALKDGLRVLLNLDKDEGAVILAVAEGSPALEAGLKKLDIILEFGGKRISDAATLQAAVAAARPGESVTLVYLRSGERKNLQIVVGGTGKAPGRTGVGDFLDETLKNRATAIREQVKALLEGDTAARMKARRYFEELLRGSKEEQDRILEQVEAVADELLGKLPGADRTQMRKVLGDMLKGLRHAIQKPRTGSGAGSQKKEAIESFLEEMLGGKKPAPQPKPDDKDDIDKLLDELLGKKETPKKEGDKPATEAGDMPVKIPAEWDKALEDILGKEMWTRLKAMMKSPEYREMLKQFFPDGFEFTPSNVKKLLQQYGIEMDQLPDRLREMGVEEDAIEKIIELLKRDDPPPAKKTPAWMGIMARDTDDSSGVTVSGVEDAGPARNVLNVGDLIIKAGGKAVKTREDLKNALSGLYAGDVLKLEVKRDGKTVKVDLKLGSK